MHRAVVPEMSSLVGMCRQSDYLLHVDTRSGTPLVTISSSFVVNLTTYSLLEGGVMTPTPTIHPRSFLGRLSTHQPLITSAGKELVRTVPYQAWNEQTGGTRPTQARLPFLHNGQASLNKRALAARAPPLQPPALLSCLAPARI